MCVCVQGEFLLGGRGGNEREHVQRMCAKGWRCEEEETRRRRDGAEETERVFDADRTDNPCRRLSASRYADLFSFFFYKTSRCFKGSSQRSALCACVLFV